MSENPFEPAVPGSPGIAIVIPSFNQGQYVETALHSVLDQSYRPLECVVVDGGSTDGTLEILKRYDARLTAWVSERDNGPYDAFGKGIALTKGEIIGWMNTDDAYLPGALAVVGDIFAQFPQVEWLTTLFPLHIDTRGRIVRADRTPGYNREGFLAGEYLPQPGAFSLGYIQQESTFWRRSLWERAGGRIDPEFGLAGDFVLWAQFFEHADLVAVAAPLAAFRIHGEQVISHHLPAYNEECRRALVKYGGQSRGAFHRWIREIAIRFPVACRAGLSRVGAMRRARVLQWDLHGERWRLEEHFI